jgi:hypothetical protein
MKRRFRTSEYKKDQVDILSNLCWIYIKSVTTQELKNNRERLIKELQPAEKKYIHEIWLLKKERVVYYYTNKYMNLGCVRSLIKQDRSQARSESIRVG